VYILKQYELVIPSTLIAWSLLYGGNNVMRNGRQPNTAKKQTDMDAAGRNTHIQNVVKQADRDSQAF
jgi:hypothetical protein